jgi:hypothetical protein
LQRVPEGSQNVKGFLNSFAFIYLVYCQIWLNILADKSQIRRQRKIGGKKKRKRKNIGRTMKLTQG